MTRSQSLYCKDILERVQRIEVYTAKGRESFMSSAMRQDAVVMCFTIIGEAIKNLDEELIAQQPQVDWRGLAGFRDILVHQYHNTVWNTVWTVAQEDLPGLKSAIIAMLKSLDGSQAPA